MVCASGIVANQTKPVAPPFVVTWDETGLVDTAGNPIPAFTADVPLGHWRSSLDDRTTALRLVAQSSPFSVLSAAGGGVTNSQASASTTTRTKLGLARGSLYAPRMLASGAVVLMVLTGQWVSGEGNAPSFMEYDGARKAGLYGAMWNGTGLGMQSFAYNGTTATGFAPVFTADCAFPASTKLVFAARVRAATTAGQLEFSLWRNTTLYRRTITMACPNEDALATLVCNVGTNTVHYLEYNELLATDADVAGRIAALRTRYNC